MPHFKAKGSLERSPRTPSWIWGPTSKESEGRGKERRESKGGKVKWRGSEGEGKTLAAVVGPHQHF